MRFEKDSSIDKLIQTVPHIAFELNDLDFELENRDFKIITESNPPTDGVVCIQEENKIIELATQRIFSSYFRAWCALEEYFQ